MRLETLGVIALVAGLALVGELAGATICSEFKADDAFLKDGSPGDLDHADKKLVKLESRGGRSQVIFCTGKWKLSRQAQVDKIQALQVPIKLLSRTKKLDVVVNIYSVRTKGWHPLLTTVPSEFGDEHAPVVRNWRDYYDPKTREIRFELRATKNGLSPVDLEFDQLSIRPVWHLQNISHEIAEKVAGGDEKTLRQHNLDGSTLQPGKDMRRPQLQPGERFRQTGGLSGGDAAEDK